MTTLLEEYRKQRRLRLEGSIYHKTQVELAYNSNRIEGSRLTQDQTRQIFETKTVDGFARIDDIKETSNHFRLFDYMLDTIDRPLTRDLLREYHRILKSGTEQAESDPVFTPGVFKALSNEVGGMMTTPPDEVKSRLDSLFEAYEASARSFSDIVDFHSAFERIHPFQDGNGRVGRMLMFRQCLVENVMPFIMRDDMKLFYYRGLQNYDDDKARLLDTCRSFQDDFEARFMPLVPHVEPPSRE